MGNVTMQSEKRRSSLLITIVLLGLNLIALQILLSGHSAARLDLTRGGLYSITSATERLITSLEEEVTIVGYFSSKTHPKLSPLVPEIVDMLSEYEAVSSGKVHIEIIDPGEDEAAEKIANDRYGVKSTPFRLASKYETGIVNAYFALVVKYGDEYVRYGFEDLIEVEPLPDGDVDVRLRNLEYDLSRAIKKAAYGFRGGAELFERVEGEVVLTAIITPESLPEIFSGVPDALGEAAAELKEKGGDKFRYEEIYPDADPAIANDVYRRFGAQPMSVGLFGGTRFYLYGILQVGDQIEQIPLTGESVTAADIREAVENSMRRKSPGFLKTIGVVTPGSDLPPEVRAQLQMRGQQMPPPEFEQIRLHLQQEYTVESVNLTGNRGVPSEIDVLLVVEPRNLDQRAVYNIDQFLMRGGRVMACVGSFKANFDQSGLSVAPQQSGLNEWLKHMGVEILPSLVLDDRNRPLPLPQVRQTALGLLRTWKMAPYPYLVSVQDEGLVNKEITGGLEVVGIYWGSPLVVSADSLQEVEVFEILRSSKKSWTSTDLSAVSFVDYEVPAEGTQSYQLAVALSGKFSSYFGDRPVPTRKPAGDEADESADAISETPILASPETRLVVVGNSAFLSDMVAGVLSQPEGGYFVENLTFVKNIIDWSVLDSDLISIRAHGVSTPKIKRLEKGTEISIETVNYVAPTVLLLGLAGFLTIKRRKTRPIVEPDRPAYHPAASDEGDHQE